MTDTSISNLSPSCGKHPADPDRLTVVPLDALIVPGQEHFLWLSRRPAHASGVNSKGEGRATVQARRQMAQTSRRRQCPRLQADCAVGFDAAQSLRPLTAAAVCSP